VTCNKKLVELTRYLKYGDNCDEKVTAGQVCNDIATFSQYLNEGVKSTQKKSHDLPVSVTARHGFVTTMRAFVLWVQSNSKGNGTEFRRMIEVSEQYQAMTKVDRALGPNSKKKKKKNLAHLESSKMQSFGWISPNSTSASTEIRMYKLTLMNA
jgi:hypothetical protein